MIEALFDYLDEISDKRFRWGDHDCFTFTNEAWRRMHGTPWADPDWTYLDPYGLPVPLHDLRARYPVYSVIADAVDTRLDRIDYTPPRGALVTAYAGEGRWRLGVAFGLSVGSHGAFLSAHGVRYIPIEDIQHAWVKRQ